MEEKRRYDEGGGENKIETSPRESTMIILGQTEECVRLDSVHLV